MSIGIKCKARKGGRLYRSEVEGGRFKCHEWEGESADGHRQARRTTGPWKAKLDAGESEASEVQGMCVQCMGRSVCRCGGRSAER